MTLWLGRLVFKSRSLQDVRTLWGECLRPGTPLEIGEFVPYVAIVAAL